MELMLSVLLKSVWSMYMGFFVALGPLVLFLETAEERVLVAGFVFLFLVVTMMIRRRMMSMASARIPPSTANTMMTGLLKGAL